MATVEQAVQTLTTALSQISGQVDKVSAEQQQLLDKLNSIPTGDMTPAQQKAVDDAISLAQGIATRLQAIDDKVPDEVVPTPPAS